MAAEERNIIIAINFPKKQLTGDDIIDDIKFIDNDNVNIVNIFQSDIPDNKNFDIMEQLDLSKYNLPRNKRYANIEYDRDEIQEGYKNGIHFFRIYNYTNQLLLREIQARLIVLIQRDLINYDEFIDVINIIQDKMKLKIIVVDLVSHTIDGDELETQQVVATFKQPEYMDIVFLSEEQKDASGGKRKSKRKRRTKRRKSNKK